MLQEHWLADEQLCVLGDISDLFLYTGVSGFDSVDVLSGRPYGGCAILWRSDLSFVAENIITHSRRVCAIRLTSDIYKLLLFSVYLPHEGGELLTDEFMFQLDVIDNVLSENSDCHVVVAGDFNVDFARGWVHTAILDGFCDKNGLIPADRHASCSVDYSLHITLT